MTFAKEGFPTITSGKSVTTINTSNHERHPYEPEPSTVPEASEVVESCTPPHDDDELSLCDAVTSASQSLDGVSGASTCVDDPPGEHIDSKSSATGVRLTDWTLEHMTEEDLAELIAPGQSLSASKHDADES